MRRWATAVLTLLAMASAGGAAAQNFPERPITIVNPYSAGGPADLLARTITGPMGEILGQPVVVENKPGAGTAIAASYVARSKPDGYTLFIGGAPTHIVNPAIRENVGYKGIDDFATVATIAVIPNVLVVPSSRPWTSVKKLVAAAKEAGGSMTFGSVGVGSLPQMLGVLLQQRGDIKLTHVPYKGAAPTVVDLLAGNVDMAFLNVSPVLGHVRDGKLRALGVANDVRATQLPDVPTMEEAGFPDFAMSTWYGISAPAGTPKSTLEALAGAIEKSLKMPEVAKTLEERGAQVAYRGPDEFAAFLKADAERMLDLIEASGIKPN